MEGPEQSARKRGPQAYNHKELYPANNSPNALGGDSSQSLQGGPTLTSEALSRDQQNRPGRCPSKCGYHLAQVSAGNRKRMQ